MKITIFSKTKISLKKSAIFHSFANIFQYVILINVYKENFHHIGMYLKGNFKTFLDNSSLILHQKSAVGRRLVAK